MTNVECFFKKTIFFRKIPDFFHGNECVNSENILPRLFVYYYKTNKKQKI